MGVSASQLAYLAHPALLASFNVTNFLMDDCYTKPGWFKGVDVYSFNQLKYKTYCLVHYHFT